MSEVSVTFTHSGGLMRTATRFLATAAILALLSPAAWAQVSLPHYDGFNYPVGQNLGAQPGWASLNTGDSLLVAAGSLSYPGFPASSGNKLAYDGPGVDAAKEFVLQTTGTVYYSYLFRVTSLGSLDTVGGYFTTFYQSATSTTGGTCVWTRRDGSAFDIGVSVRITTPISWSSVKSLNTTYLIVASYEFVSGTTNDVSRIWINPDASTFGAATPPTETLTSTNNTTDLTGVARVQIRQDGLTTTPFIELDELRIGTKWADVTTAVKPTNVVKNEGVTPSEFRLEQNYPNPFNPSTNIRFSLDATKAVSLKITDVLGRDVATLVNQTLEAGTYTVKWDATSVPSGVYFCTVRAGNSLATQRMILSK
jgi:hypothetical protein